MASHVRWVLVLAAVALCCGCASAGPGASGNGQGRAQHALASALRDRQFVSQALTGRALVAGTQIRLSFAPGELSADAGCNRLFGAYRLDGDVLRMSGMGATEMGCDAERHAQDEWLRQLLTGSPTLALEGAQLTISAAPFTLVLLDREVASPDRPLVGTRWIGNGIGDGESMTFYPVTSAPSSPAP